MLLWTLGACASTTNHAGNDGGVRTDGASGDAGDSDGSATLAIEPLDTVVTVFSGQPLPTVQYTATVNGQPVVAGWGIDRVAIGTIDPHGGLFTPTGNQGGLAIIMAAYGSSLRATTTVTVRIQGTDIGDPAYPAPTPGAGGYGGVGGDGPGAPASSAQQTTLNGTPVADSTVSLLYPYDHTVWPRGLLAPLVQWQPGSHSFDAALIHIKETNFEYRGYFAKPSSKPFANLPIPQAAWTALTYSNVGEPVDVEIVLAEGSTAYGPYRQTWTVAHATLKGTVYYQSYGTDLVKNAGESDFNGSPFGGATLGIKIGATDPTLVAGTESTDKSGCRVCHAVSANGSALITQHGEDYGLSSLYALTTGNAETVLTGRGGLNFPALYPDGTMVFSGAGGMYHGDTASHLYALPAGTLITTPGLPADLQGTLPTFSPDGRHVAFNYYAGTGGDQRSLGVIDFDPATMTFSNLRKIHTPATGAVVWSSFLPTSDALVFEVELVTSNFGFTWHGARGELWWADLATGTAARLEQVNGVGYLPVGAQNHDQDQTLNYEPTVGPIASGGYAWLVFTSRRLYGNVATIDPWSSDPRSVDLLSQVTTKKLWVAPIDLGAPAGSDPSHPAFYLPAQEILAGNSRGFWSLDVCHDDGIDCQTGDECCGGYCRDDGSGPVCTSQPPTCSLEYERCTTDSDCCDVDKGIVCINGFCVTAVPPID
jgi:hypothetical protein